CFAFASENRRASRGPSGDPADGWSDPEFLESLARSATIAPLRGQTPSLTASIVGFAGSAPPDLLVAGVGGCAYHPKCPADFRPAAPAVGLHFPLRAIGCVRLRCGRCRCYRLSAVPSRPRPYRFRLANGPLLAADWPYAAPIRPTSWPALGPMPGPIATV